MAAGSGRVFISYRRQETAWPARQLYELLAGRFGAEKIFKDVDNIAPGEDFVDRLTTAVAQCEVLLALIGPQWLELRDEHGERRLDDPFDFVRLELSAALQRGVLVVPILVDGARMPPAAQLPSDLVALTRRQAVSIDPVGFNTDRLMETLTGVLSQPTAFRPPVMAAGQASGESPAAAPRATAATPAPEPVTAAPVEPDVSVPAEPAAAAPQAAAVPPPSRRPTRLMVSIMVGLGALLAAVALWAVPQFTRTAATPSGALTSAATSPSTQAVTPTGSPSGGVAGAAIPAIVAHRGGLEEHQFETQQAMEAAAAAGFAVETDVRYTSDGVPVLVHDEKATKGLDCGGADIRVSRTTWAKLRETCHSKPTQKDPRQYDVPTLDATMEGIAAASPDAWVLAEVKTEQTPAQRRDFLGVFSKYGLTDRLVVTSFDPAHLRAIAATDPGTRRLLFVSGKRVPASELAADDLWGVAVEQGSATASYVADLHAKGLAVMTWFANDEAAWQVAAKLKPDMVLTDYPARYQQWLQGR